jgi:hypothetical protein
VHATFEFEQKLVVRETGTWIVCAADSEECWREVSFSFSENRIKRILLMLPENVSWVTLFVGAGFCEEAAYPLIMFILWVTFLVLATISDSGYHSVRLFGCAQYSFCDRCPWYSSLGEIFRGSCVAKDPKGAERPILGFAVCLTGFQPGPGTRYVSLPYACGCVWFAFVPGVTATWAFGSRGWKHSKVP